ncbi:T-lymphoma invasion and metastasis-inducing protein 1 [Nematolebias whitei]|uniref:T-lymphoma invasion and metastasis-inducing protein 1 n=1 Tax=Nematolebias whitei TaxID=451745 RepID=UPI0018980BAB|nr:T-lymphoma invasion and metastasis-inducing protein 1 [Nematolebias whitei]
MWGTLSDCHVKVQLIICLKAGDEILSLNGKPASDLQMDDMKAAFAGHMLTLSVSTLPQLDPKVLCSCPPRRSDVEQETATDIFSQSQEDILDEVSGLTVQSLDESLEEEPQLSPRDHQEDRTFLTASHKVKGCETTVDVYQSLPPFRHRLKQHCRPKPMEISSLLTTKVLPLCDNWGWIQELSTEQVPAFCRSLHDMNSLECPMSSSSSSSSSSLSQSPVSALPSSAGAGTQRQLSHADKLRKVINELVETEKTYVKDLHCLMERYLTPLQKENFLTQEELDDLFGNLSEMVEFQVEFLQTLEDGIRLVPDLDRLESVEDFKKVLFSLGGSFLYYADRFKIYSAFCASHTKVPKVLAKAKTDPEFKAFLAARNPRQQHSSTLESYLIKPIQRVLKYPLLLKELYYLTDPDSEEHYHLDVAMKAMNKVASHINEMQKLHEEYGTVFDQLINEQTSDKKEVLDLSMGDLLLHSTVVWMNPTGYLVKSKKDVELAAFVFKTAVVFVHKGFSKHRKKIGGSHRSTVSEDRDSFRFRHMIPTKSLHVCALPSKCEWKDSEASAVCEIVHTRSESEGRPERVFQLCCSSPDSKKDLLKAVHSILREKQRRQLLKSESLPRNQQYVPFGGKRLQALKGARPAMSRAESAPFRNLARRKLVRSRITVDTDLVFHGDNNNCYTDADPSQHSSYPSSSSPHLFHGPHQSHKPQGEDTDCWVEEQFNLSRYEDQCDGTDAKQVKETDILSDDDEYCKSVRPLEENMGGLNLQSRVMNRQVETRSEMKQNAGSATSCSIPTSSCGTSAVKLVPLKQCAVEGATDKDHSVIWVRRDEFNNRCNSDVF